MQKEKDNLSIGILDISGFETFKVSSLLIGARSRRCPITGVRFELFVIGYPRDLHVNNARFNGFFRNVSHSFQQFKKMLQRYSHKRTSQDIFNSKICYRYN